MFRLLVMSNFRHLSKRHLIISSEVKRRGCALCNSHIVRNKLGKHEHSLQYKHNIVKRFSSNDLSLMMGTNLTGENLINEEVAEMLEELEEIREDRELLGETLDPTLLPPVPTPSTTKTGRKSISKTNRELMVKIKSDELEKAGKERNLNFNLECYTELCVNCGFLNIGLATLKFYLAKKSELRITSVEIFNNLMDGYARIGNIEKFTEVWSLMEKEKLRPNETSFASRLEAIARSTRADKHELIKSTTASMESQGIKINNIFEKNKWRRNSRDVVLTAIRAVQPRFTPTSSYKDLSYNTGLLKNLKGSKGENLKSPVEGILRVDESIKLFEEQVSYENKFFLDVKSVEKSVDPDELVLKSRSKLEELNQMWGKTVMDSFDRDLSLMAAIFKNLPTSSKQINMYPYLTVLDKEDYKEILLYQIRKLAEGSETFSPTVGMLYKEIGSQVKLRYDRKMSLNEGVLNKMGKVYRKYMNWYVDPSSRLSKNGRQEWQLLLHENPSGPSVDSERNAWPIQVLHGIGKFLFKIILRDIKIDANIFRTNQPVHLVPGFYPVFRRQGYLRKEELKPHPVLSRLFRAARLPHLTFSVPELPMVCPPLPWTSLTSGGFAVSKTHLIRVSNQAVQQWERLKETPTSQLYPIFDALNQLSAVPWIVNKDVLDVVIEVFNSGGNAKLDIPEPPSSCVLPEVPLPLTQGKSEKYLAYRNRMMLRRKKAEMYSLWCDALYRLSLANHFRDRMFWLPHNMDFRGRVYPCPPHLNHLGGDMARSLLMFALGKPLGPDGFNWLKMHVINLTGLKKRDSLEDRLKFADEMMPNILDSAENPLGGKKWWTKSEYPWQTLACCMEIKKALSCKEGLGSYVCHYPVHQDGSCNGLQHYAALGRDAAGAYSVNLSPAPLPQDVYSSVCSIVERERAEDAAKGVKVANILEGFVKRKVIKQTIMTTVYGVTRFGARLQIAKQLKDIDNFPQEYVWPASTYLVAKTFASLREMFTSTREIQDWFTESARQISQTCGQNVEYVTPLGLPVVQPYYRHKSFEHRKTAVGQVADFVQLDMFERPNVMKQKNAFPPNFIHSLDSCHMMLTSIYCERQGITFVSVHDCYWTHPCTIPLMNKICREQFVALHSEPILEDLSDFLVKRYGYSEESLLGDKDVVADAKRKLNSVLRKVPQKGLFKLENILDSVYFFS